MCEAVHTAGLDVILWSTNWSAGLGTAAGSVVKPAEAPYRIEFFEAQPEFFAGYLPGSRELQHAVKERAGQFDVIHVHSLWNPVASFALRACRKAGIAYVSSPHGMLDPVVLCRNALLKRIWAELLERHNVECASLVHFTTKGEKKVAERCGWKLPTAVIAANPLDKLWWEVASSALPGGPEQCLPLSLQARTGHPWVVFVGRISWVKNLPALIEGFAGLDDDEQPQLILVGPDTEGLARPLRIQARALGVERRVHFTGELETKQVQAVLKHARVLALVSEKENFGLAAVEALRVGVPVILSHGVNLDVVARPPLVQRVAPHSTQILTALKRIIQTEVNRSELRSQARLLAVELSDPVSISMALRQGCEMALANA